MVAVRHPREPLRAHDLRLPATVLAATDRPDPADALRAWRPCARRGTQIRREVQRLEESRPGRHRRRHPDEPDLRQWLLVVQHAR